MNKNHPYWAGNIKMWKRGVALLGEKARLLDWRKTRPLDPRRTGAFVHCSALELLQALLQLLQAPLKPLQAPIKPLKAPLELLWALLEPSSEQLMSCFRSMLPPDSSVTFQNLSSGPIWNFSKMGNNLSAGLVGNCHNDFLKYQRCFFREMFEKP